LIPSGVWKYISGWNNYSGKVTSQEMIESEMGYRGSKSIAGFTIGTRQFKPSIVKEQRVDGSWLLLATPNRSLRCTLNNFERNRTYKSTLAMVPWSSGLMVQPSILKVWILAKQTNRYFSSRTLSLLNIHTEVVTLQPAFITGFIDGEGSFRLMVVKNPKSKLGWAARLIFQITLAVKDINLLESLKSQWGVGNIYSHKDTCIYVVNRIDDLGIVIEHMDKFPLLTQKYGDFLLFKQAFEMMTLKTHLTSEGLQELVKIKASMNKGLTDELNLAFPNLISNRPSTPILTSLKKVDPNWFAGFISAEGCFYIDLYKSSDSLLGEKVRLKIILTQHSRDLQLMNLLPAFFDCGRIYEEKVIRFIVTKFSDIENKIIPFLSKYPLQGVKHQDYLQFCQAAEILKKKEHLTKEGLKKIRTIKESMNSKRLD